ncbi:hypothetical protein [Bacillus pseudomycoides]|uniref:hypothetical protein n=1 Tax=Bacillus pseudomycoides TaxID=64104 RepID=UPI000BED4F2C|nr:hypothetical protein [Bacillus pseudomycoides]PEB42231.1 hypothetical protein COO06_07925 [Bacillus pseudomycoides]
MKNIFSVFTKKGRMKKKHSDFIGVAGEGKQFDMLKEILEDLSNSENRNRNSLQIGKTGEGLTRFYNKYYT